MPYVSEGGNKIYLKDNEELMRLFLNSALFWIDSTIDRG